MNKPLYTLLLSLNIIIAIGQNNVRPDLNKTNESRLPVSLSGSYTIDNTIPTTAPAIPGGNFNSFTAAINCLNTETLSGNVIFLVAANQTFNENVPVITKSGTPSCHISFIKNGAGANPVLHSTGSTSAYDAGFSLAGVDYYTFDMIDVSSSSFNNLEYGFYIYNSTTNKGAQYNTISNCEIHLNYYNGCYDGIFQSQAVTATDSTMANSYNLYKNIYIDGTKNGIRLEGSSNYPDKECLIDLNTIGNPTAYNSGNPTSISYGILAKYQANVIISNNTVQRMSTSSAYIYGIYLQYPTGIGNSVNNNKVGYIRAYGTGTNVVTGIGLSSLYFCEISAYNNCVSNLFHGSSSTPGTITIKGISSSVLNSSMFRIYHNSVQIRDTNVVSSAAFYCSGDKSHIINNIFSNISLAAATSKRYAIYCSSSELESNYNDLYIHTTDTNSFTGYFASDFKSLSDWVSGTGNLDEMSHCTDPVFVSNNDLHSSSVILNGAGVSGTGVLTDIDQELRDSQFPDIGADENLIPAVFSCNVPAPGNTIASVSEICWGDSVSLSLENAVPGTGVTYQWQQSYDSLTFTDIPGFIYKNCKILPQVYQYYRCIATCHNGPVSTASIPVRINFQSTVDSVNSVSRCGTGSVTLNTTGSPGSTILWFDNENGVEIASGNSYTTPFLTTTTDFYVSAGLPTQVTGGLTDPMTIFGLSGSGNGLWFNAYRHFTLISVDVYPTTTGSVTVSLIDANDSILDSDTFVIANAVSGIPATLNLNFNVPVQNGLRLLANTSSELSRIISVAMPISLGRNGEITSGCYSNIQYSNNYYYFYNWNMTGWCESALSIVSATIDPAPPVNIQSTTTELCNGESVGISVSSPNDPGYQYEWSPGLLSGNSYVFSPSETTTYIIDAHDTTGNATAGCHTSDTITITVFPTPTITAFASDDTICDGSSVNLFAESVSGDIQPTLLLNEGFESVLSPTWSVYNAGGGNSWAIDANNAYTGNHCYAYHYNPYFSANAWAFTGPHYLTQNNETRISFWYKVIATIYPENLKITVGNTNSYLNQTTILWDNNGASSLINTIWEKAEITYVPDSSGNYYFGFNCYSAADMFNLYIDDVYIETDVNIPAQFTWTSDPSGYSSTNSYMTDVYPDSSMTFYVTAENYEGCSASDTLHIYVDPCLGISEKTMQLVMYPNPAIDEVYIDVTSLTPDQYHLSLRNITGESILENDISIDKSPLTINIANIEPGSYFIILRNATDSFYGILTKD